MNLLDRNLTTEAIYLHSAYTVWFEILIGDISSDNNKINVTLKQTPK